MCQNIVQPLQMPLTAVSFNEDKVFPYFEYEKLSPMHMFLDYKFIIIYGTIIFACNFMTKTIH